jgi:hypothetical protein
MLGWGWGMESWETTKARTREKLGLPLLFPRVRRRQWRVASTKVHSWFGPMGLVDCRSIVHTYLFSLAQTKLSLWFFPSLEIRVQDKLILTNSCLSSLPMYVIGCYFLPKGVHTKMDTITSRFI